LIKQEKLLPNKKERDYIKPTYYSLVLKYAASRAKK